MTEGGQITLDSPAAVINRELSWLSFARRVLALAEDPGQPLLERVKFAAIMGTIYDEFAMKRIGGLFRQVRKGSARRGPDGLTPDEVLEACLAELRAQQQLVASLVDEQLRPALRDAGLPILDVGDLGPSQRDFLARYCMDSVEPILVPLAADAAHPFPFISNLGLNLAVLVNEPGRRNPRFVRIKVPTNRPRWVPLPDQAGWVPLEQAIAANLSIIFPRASASACFFFRVTRGAKDDPWADQADDEDAELSPGAIIGMVTAELTARKYAGVVRLEVSADMPTDLRSWLADQLGADPADVIATPGLLSLGDLMDLPVEGHAELRDAPHEPVTHPRLRGLDHTNPAAVFDEIRRGDILVHLPYHSFDTSILRFLRSAAVDPAVLAIKLTIYRTGRRSPIVAALKEAARRGKQVAVLVEITARFDEAPNISWGKELEEAGAHVAYGVERVKTHVKLALVVREEPDGLRRYVHVGTGNYHEGTARLYEDLGLLSADPELAAHAAAVFNELTAGIPAPTPGKLLVAPHDLRERFIAAIRREAEHARAGRPCGIRAKMNQLQDPQMIQELYQASLVGVPIVLNVRGLCCLRAGVPGVSPTIKVSSTLGRFLEHSRIYRFENGGRPEFFIGSADWMTRNLSRRMEAVAPVCDPVIKAELETILRTYEEDNCSAWDMQPDGGYLLRHPAAGEPLRCAQEVFIERAASSLRPGSPVGKRLREGHMATDVREIDRKRGPGASGPGGLHDPPLTRHSSVGEVVLSYLRDQVAAIARHDPLVRRDEPDAVHQMRVATRRARSALQAFGGVIDREATRPLGEELKWLAVTLGQARDTEVMLERLKASLAGIPSALVVGPVEARITAHFTAELAQAGQTAVAALDGRRYRRLRDDLDGLLARPPLTPLAERRAGEALAKPVRRTGRRLLAALAAVPDAEDRDAALHDARKAAKRARYAAEAAVPALGRAASRQAAAAKDLQEVLGDHHDSVVARAVLLDLAEKAREAGEDTFTYGLMYQHQAGRAASMEQALPPFTVETLA